MAAVWFLAACTDLNTGQFLIINLRIKRAKTLPSLRRLVKVMEKARLLRSAKCELVAALNSYLTICSLAERCRLLAVSQLITEHF